MDTSQGRRTSRSGSITQRRPSVDSPKCRQSTESKALDVAASRVDNAAITQSPRDITSSESSFHSYASTTVTAVGATPLTEFYSVAQSKNNQDTRRPKSARSLSPPTQKVCTPPSDMSIRHDLFQLLEQVRGAEGIDLVDIYTNAPLQPPVTHDSLGELDIVRIVNNPKLRHDVNFDKELHFRPNLDGSRGKHKLKSAEDYWKALSAELELYNQVGLQYRAAKTHDDEYWGRMMLSSQKRLPGMFETIRDVLKTLVPEQDQSTVMERLDISMIMQQIARGMFDMMGLANWLARLLKAHCAPMRDDWIDQMVRQTQRGVDEGDQDRVVLGLRQLLGILEAMKLDVANHQIRHLRPLLIEDTVVFQQRYHAHRISTGRVDVFRARRWLEKEHQRLLVEHATSADKLQTMSSALLRAVLSPYSMSNLPDTFQLDLDRLRAVRHDLHHLITLEVCCDLFDGLVKAGAVSAEALLKARTALRSSLADILGDRRRPADHAGNLAVEIVRQAGEVQALPMTSFASDKIDYIEGRLKTELPLSSSMVAFKGAKVHKRYVAQLHDSIKAGLKMPIATLHEAMIPQSLTSTASLATAGSKPSKSAEKRQSVEDVLRRLTHIAVLHWHVWFPTVYDLSDEQLSQIMQSSLAAATQQPERSTRGTKSSSSNASNSTCTGHVNPMRFVDSPTPEPQVQIQIQIPGQIQASAESRALENKTMYQPLTPPPTKQDEETQERDQNRSRDTDNVPETPTGPAMSEPKA